MASREKAWEAASEGGNREQVRHGQYNTKARSDAEATLTAAGRQQAQVLGKCSNTKKRAALTMPDSGARVRLMQGEWLAPGR